MTQKTLLIYTQEFLSPSMTFIARQIEAARTHFKVSVLTRFRRNQDLFDFEPVDVVRVSLIEGLLARLMRKLTSAEWSIGSGAAKSMESVIRARKPDLIHAHFGPSGLAILPLAKQLGIPLACTFHGFDASVLARNSSYRRALASLFDYADIIAVSECMRRDLVELGAASSRTHVHYIGAPLGRFAVEQRRPMAEKLGCGLGARFLQVSNFVEKKGHVYTVRAFSALVALFPQCELVLVGAGPELRAVQALVKDLGLSSRVHFMGHRDTAGVASLMREADCFLHHSVTSLRGDKEGIPTVIMEAMASGLPVIATWHSGIPELVQDGISGLLVKERDVGSYSGAMMSVLRDRGQFGLNARRRVEQLFDLDECTRRLCDRYSTILQNRVRESPANIKRGCS